MVQTVFASAERRQIQFEPSDFTINSSPLRDALDTFFSFRCDTLRYRFILISKHTGFEAQS